jgi:hypothetical protein
MESPVMEEFQAELERKLAEKEIKHLKLLD